MRSVVYLTVLAVLRYVQATATVDAHPVVSDHGADWETEWDWESIEKADSHDHWERIVRRSAESLRGEDLDDDTAHIVDVQEYYRDAFQNGWESVEDHEEKVSALLSELHTARIQGGFTEAEREEFQKKAAKALGMTADSKPIQGRYIVLFQDGTNDYVLDRTMEILQEANTASDGRLRADHLSTIRSIRKGVIATLNRKTVELMKKHPLLDTIEVDVAIRRSSIQYRPAASHSLVSESQSSVTWNLDRLDQHDNHLDGQYTPEGDGANVDIYIIDTGVLATHEEFGDRVHYAGYDAIDDLTGTDGQGHDCNGHGTHCAGTAAGRTYGVAKQAQIYNLRALDCDGTGAVSGIVKGIDLITERYKTSSRGRRVVISQSLGVAKSESLNTAIIEATNAGIVMVGAAGNQGEDSCNYSPASARVGIAVGATDRNDRVVMFSNTGECMDVFAPGKDIKSASHACDTCTKSLSGTSMATPHAAGYVAILMSLHPNLTPEQVKGRLIAISSKDKVQLATISENLASRTHNRILYVPKPTAIDSDVGQALSFGRAGVQSFHDPR